MTSSQDHNGNESSLPAAAGAVSALWRYPVKSMLGESLSAVDVNSRGFYGDRGIAVVDDDGKFGSGKNTRRFRRMDGLLDFQARLRHTHGEEQTAVVTLPSGDTHASDDPQVASAVSARVGRPVQLRPEEQVSHFDSGPIHVISVGATRWLQRFGPGFVIDPRRFRPNIVVELDGPGPAEDDWVGRTIAIGDQVRLAITQRTERCVMVNLAHGELPAEQAVLATVADANALCAGVYAEVTRPGAVRVGDAIRVLAS
jgi:uncharacterized protein